MIIFPKNFIYSYPLFPSLVFFPQQLAFHASQLSASQRKATIPTLSKLSPRTDHTSDKSIVGLHDKNLHDKWEVVNTFHHPTFPYPFWKHTQADHARLGRKGKKHFSEEASWKVSQCGEIHWQFVLCNNKAYISKLNNIVCVNM